MKISYQLPILVFTLFIITSCQKVVDLKLSNTEPQLVIEGSVTDKGGPQTVFISRSVDFEDPNKFPGVSGAKVKIMWSRFTYNLTEVSPGTYVINPLGGQPGRTYTLQAEVDGQTYTAVSTMPYRVFIDSVAIDEQTIGRSTTKTVAVYYNDPPNEKNQYRFVMYINGVQVKSVFVRNDQFSDDRQVRALLYQRDITIKSGDRIDIDMQCIDENIYTYWFTFSQQQGNMGNASATPSNPPNNFDKSVLGYFSAQTQQRRSVIVR